MAGGVECLTRTYSNDLTDFRGDVMNILSAKNPRIINTDPTIIFLTVTSDENEEFDYPVSENDPVSYSAELYKQAVKGEFGGITPYEEPVKTEEELILAIQNAVVEYLNAPAKAKLYDSIQSAALRAGFPGPFHDEGVAFASWMDACWVKCYELLAEVKAGTRPVMSPEGVVSELPTLVLP